MQATVASVTSPAFFVSPVKLLRSRRYLELQRCSLFLHSHNRQLSLTCSVKVSAENWFSERSKFKTHINKLTEKIWEARPQAAKEFPWKKAKDLVVQRILFLGEKALKWLLITLFVISSLSDVVFSISRNRELIIPVGLFIGTAMANFLKETTQEMFQNTKEGELVRQLVGISIFFVLIKFISQYLTLSGRVFLSHISNGGLMQVLWLGKKLQDAKDAENGQTPSSNLDASITDNLETEI